MRHPEEGTIHAWLDGALSPDESAALETHVGECAACGDAVAEARGIIAGASRIILSLDGVPGGVVPGAGERPAPRAATAEAIDELAARREWKSYGAARWWQKPVTRAAAVLIVLLGGSYAVARQNVQTAGDLRLSGVVVYAAHVESASDEEWGEAGSESRAFASAARTPVPTPAPAVTRSAQSSQQPAAAVSSTPEAFAAAPARAPVADAAPPAPPVAAQAQQFSAAPGVAAGTVAGARRAAGGTPAPAPQAAAGTAAPAPQVGAATMAPAPQVAAGTAAAANERLTTERLEERLRRVEPSSPQSREIVLRGGNPAPSAADRPVDRLAGGAVQDTRAFRQGSEPLGATAVRAGLTGPASSRTAAVAGCWLIRVTAPGVVRESEAGATLGWLPGIVSLEPDAPEGNEAVKELETATGRSGSRWELLDGDSLRVSWSDSGVGRLGPGAVEGRVQLDLGVRGDSLQGTATRVTVGRMVTEIVPVRGARCPR